MVISQIYDTAPVGECPETVRRSFACLETLHIPFTRVEHEAAGSMEDCTAIGEVLGVSICKNLLLTPRNKSAFYLLCMPGDKPFVTRDFSKQIGTSRLSFASPEDMERLLGVTPGSASVLALLHDPDGLVQLVMDRAVWDSEYFGCHPCRNTGSLRVKTADIKNIFLPFVRHEAMIVDL